MLKKLIKKFSKKKKGKNKYYKAGLIGEKDVIKELKKLGHTKNVLHDTIIRDPKSGKMCQIDLMVVLQDKIYIVEVKTQNFNSLEGKLTSASWVAIYGNGKKYETNNIYEQIKRQETSLKNLLNLYNIHVPISSILYIKNKNKIKVNVPGLLEKGIYIKQDINFFNTLEGNKYSKRIVKCLNSENAKNQYVKKYKKKV